MTNEATSWRSDLDVLVIGSGTAGLTAAIKSHDEGLKVAVLETIDKVGGTTALSAGAVWVPQNHHMAEAGVDDSKKEAMAEPVAWCTPSLAE